MRAVSGLQGSPSRPWEPSCASLPRGPRGCWSGSPCAGRGQGRRLEPERTWVRVSTGRVPGPAPLLPPQAPEGPPVLAQPSEPATPTPGGPRGQALRPEGAGAVAPGACWGSPGSLLGGPRGPPRSAPAQFPRPSCRAPSSHTCTQPHADRPLGPGRRWLPRPRGLRPSPPASHARVPCPDARVDRPSRLHRHPGWHDAALPPHRHAQTTR